MLLCQEIIMCPPDPLCSLLHSALGGWPVLTFCLWLVVEFSSWETPVGECKEEGDIYLWVSHSYSSFEQPAALRVTALPGPCLWSREHPRGPEPLLFLAPGNSTIPLALFHSAHTFVNSLFIKASLDYPSLILLPVGLTHITIHKNDM